MFEVTPVQLKAELDQGLKPFLLDVRESDELEVSKIEGVVHIPMGEIADRIHEIPQDQDVVLICRSGGRSGKITEYLLAHGYSRVRNMVTGMNGWVKTVDPTQPTY